jgi:GH15 family glucan-1,4-alpha-glucosidase
VRVDGYAPIADYAAIGDGRTIALVARDGSIDWMPLPTIDQGAVFWSLLDAERGGRFRLAPGGEFTVRRRYLPRSNVLETTFTTPTGTLRVTDALTMQDGAVLPWVELARRVECTGGSVRLHWEVAPRFDFGREETRIVRIGGVPVALGKRLRLSVLVWELGEARLTASSVEGVADLSEGDGGLLVCVATDRQPIPCPPRDEVEVRFKGTVESWRRWLVGHGYEGPWKQAVERSALALKLLVYAPSGAIAAAGTSALPERIGGRRNYDYRFSWIRDSSFTLDALSALGYREQVHASLAWLLRVTEASHPRMQPLYGLDGRVPRGRERLEVPGYRGSAPVELGNVAATQLQLGNYGDLFDTVWRYVRNGNALDPPTGVRLAEVANLITAIWRNEDSGVWELPDHRHYTLSKMSCCLALARAVQLAEDGHVPADDAVRWRATRDEIRHFVETRCWSDAKQSYTFYAGSDSLDCGVLLGARFEYVDPTDERMTSTIDAIRRELDAGGPLLYRYTGAAEIEGAFVPCSFWLVGALAKARRLREARELMEELLPLANDLGLWSEEIDPETHELLGNFPQALTHLSLIIAAVTVAGVVHEHEEEET